MEIADFFAAVPEALAIHRAVEAAVSSIGEAEVRVSKSEVAFYRKHPFAATWIPRQYLSGDHSPLILRVYLRRRDMSPRWKEVVEPAIGRFTHHTELRSSRDVNAFVRSRLKEGLGAPLASAPDRGARLADRQLNPTAMPKANILPSAIMNRLNAGDPLLSRRDP